MNLDGTKLPENSDFIRIRLPPDQGGEQKRKRVFVTHLGAVRLVVTTTEERGKRRYRYVLHMNFDHFGKKLGRRPHRINLPDFSRGLPEARPVLNSHVRGRVRKRLHELLSFILGPLQT